MTHPAHRRLVLQTSICCLKASRCATMSNKVFKVVVIASMYSRSLQLYRSRWRVMHLTGSAVREKNKRALLTSEGNKRNSYWSIINGIVQRNCVLAAPCNQKCATVASSKWTQNDFCKWRISDIVLNTRSSSPLIMKSRCAYARYTKAIKLVTT